MLKIKIVCVGDLSQSYWKLAQQDYLKRIKKQANINTYLINEVNLTTIVLNIKQESTKIAQYCQKYHDYQWFLWDLSGKLITSEQLSQLVINNQNYHQGKIGFIIGGSNGVSDDLKTNSQLTMLAFGKITLPHQLCYLVLLEQIYRAFQIINNQPYHK